MKRILLAGAAFAAMTSASMAADYAAPVDVDVWSGFYVGIAGGYAFKDITYEIAIFDGDVKSDDFIIGAYYGRNWQSGNIVFGLDSSFNYIGLEEEDITEGLGDTANIEANFLGLSRLRVGYAFDNVLVYAAGGLATTKIDVEDVEEPLFDDGWAFGFTVGAGVETKFSEHWSARLEYAYFNIETDELDYDGAFETNYEIEGHIVRAGVAYNF